MIIYDRSNQVMMMQCNRFALGRGKLEKYLNRVWNVKNECIILCPISKTIDARELKKKQYKRLLLRFENIHPIEKNHRPFSQIVNSYYEMGGITGEVIISLGRGRRRSGLNQEKVPQMLEDIYENQDILSDAALKVKDDDDDSVDIINLFDNALCSYIDFQLEKRTVLDFGYATNLMVNVYEDNKGEIEQLIS